MGTCSYTWIDEENDKLIEKECLEETWEGSDEFCIFHDPSPEKDADLFKEKLEKQMESETERYNFVGYCFPKNWNFSGKKFKVDADFRRAIFQSVYFKKATFQEKADFSQAEFQFALFRKATFHKNADFREATFHKNATFNGATFHKNADFSEATFQSAGFNSTIFQTTANFREATFQEYTNFRGASFLGYADFKSAIFKEDAFFSDSTFQNANFGCTTFRSAAYFREVTFHENANFREATFQYTDFYEATFQTRANFGCTTFRSAAYFREVTFQEDADFSQAEFHKKVELMPKSVEKIDLRYTEFLSRSYITADLTKTLFHRAFIENVAFVNCKWPKCKGLFGSYTCIYEEKNMKDKNIDISYNELETIYRDLKQNMQGHGDYSKAGEFYYREMEMRRKGAEKRRSRLWPEFYRLLAGYGENYWNTAAVSGSIILIFALLYGISDCLQYSIENPCLYQEVIDVVYFSFVTFTTLGLGDITPLTTWGKVLICLEAVIGAFMIALFVVVFVRKMTR